MKLQTVIAALAALAPMAVVAEELFGDKYSYCTGCEAKYENEDGQWNYINHTWCKVDEEKCNIPACEPVDGYPCCTDPSSEVYYIDNDGEWSVENNNWCIRSPLSEFTDVSIELHSWLDLMPGTNIYGEDSNTRRRAYFLFSLMIEKAEFRNMYEIKKVFINGEEVDIANELYYPTYGNSFRIDTHVYNEDFNTVKIIIRNKKTKKDYIKEIAQELEVSY